MESSRGIWGGLAAGVVAAAGLLALADIATVAPGTATIGTEIAIDGTGFGAEKAPKVALVSTTGGKPVKLKVVPPFTDTHVDALVKSLKKGQTGVFDLTVTPADKTAPVLTKAAAVTIDVGQIATVTPADPAAGGTVTIDGSLFGTKKPKVKVGGKTAKVTSFGDGQVVATLHKKTPAGAQTLELTNKVGTAVKVDAVTVGGSGGGGGSKNVVRARFYRDVIQADDEGVVVTAKGTGFEIVATGARGPVAYELRIDLSNFDAAAAGGRPVAVDPVLFEVKQTDGSVTTWRAAAGASGLTISKSGTTFRGDFDGDIARVSGTAVPDPLPVVGFFDVTLP